MKNKKISIVLGIVAISFMFGGCGTKMYTLTDYEENLIVHSAAHIVAKHNIRQTDGMTGILPSEEEEEIIVDPTETESTETESSNDQSGETVTNGISMAEAMGYEGLTVKYTGSETASYYREGAASTVNAGQGKVFYVMKFELSNTTEETISIDNITLNPTFKLVATDVNVKAEVTVLSKDLSTYVGEIKSGETVETVLLFEISQSKAETISQAELKTIVGDETKNIEL